MSTEIDSHHDCLNRVGTPICNLEDITLSTRCLLTSVAQIACEHTHHTQRLCSPCWTQKSLVYSHEQKQRSGAGMFVVAMVQGVKLALVSDAGRSLVVFFFQAEDGIRDA